MAKKQPEMIDALKEIDEQAYKYAKGVQRNEAIRHLCIELGINTFDEMLEYLKEKKPEWYDDLRKSAISRIYLELWFGEREIQKARKEARGGQINNRKAKPVVCVDNGMEFRSINQAAAWLKHKRTHDISDCCYGIINNVNGFHFRFKEDIISEE